MAQYNSSIYTQSLNASNTLLITPNQAQFKPYQNTQLQYSQQRVTHNRNAQQQYYSKIRSAPAILPIVPIPKVNYNIASIKEQKKQIMECLYPLIKQYTNSYLTSKISGILLESLNIRELSSLLYNPQELINRIIDIRLCLKNSNSISHNISPSKLTNNSNSNTSISNSMIDYKLLQKVQLLETYLPQKITDILMTSLTSFQISRLLLDANHIELIVHINQIKKQIHPEIMFAKLEINEPDLAYAINNYGIKLWVIYEIFSISKVSEQKQKVSESLLNKIIKLEPTLTHLIMDKIMNYCVLYQLLYLLIDKQILINTINDIINIFQNNQIKNIQKSMKKKEQVALTQDLLDDGYSLNEISVIFDNNDDNQNNYGKHENTYDLDISMKRINASIDIRSQYIVYGFIHNIEVNELSYLLYSIPVHISNLCLLYFYELTWIPYMSYNEVNNLRIGDVIDHQDIHGIFCKSKIIDKKGSNLHVHYTGWDPKWNVWADYQNINERYQFAKFESITKRQSHRLKGLKKGYFVDINPRRTHKGWRCGIVKEMSNCSGQLKVVYNIKNDKYEYVTHLDNYEEIEEFTRNSQTVHYISESIDDDYYYKINIPDDEDDDDILSISSISMSP